MFEGHHHQHEMIMVRLQGEIFQFPMMDQDRRIGRCPKSPPIEIHSLQFPALLPKLAQKPQVKAIAAAYVQNPCGRGKIATNPQESLGFQFPSYPQHHSIFGLGKAKGMITVRVYSPRFTQGRSRIQVNNPTAITLDGQEIFSTGSIFEILADPDRLAQVDAAQTTLGGFQAEFVKLGCSFHEN